jgi:hypothetical protein
LFGAFSLLGCSFLYSLFFSIKEEGELALPEEISYAIIYVA